MHFKRLGILSPVILPEFLECKSALSNRVFEVAEYLSAYRVFTEYLQSVQMDLVCPNK